MLERIHYTPIPATFADVRETRGKYIGLLVGRLAVSRLRLREATEKGEHDAAAILRDQVEALEKQLRLARAADKPKEISE